MAVLSPGQIASTEKGGQFRIERGIVIAQLRQHGLVSLGELLSARHRVAPHIDRQIEIHIHFSRMVLVAESTPAGTEYRVRLGNGGLQLGSGHTRFQGASRTAINDFVKPMKRSKRISASGNKA